MIIFLSEQKLKDMIDKEVRLRIQHYMPPDLLYSLLIPGMRKIANEEIDKR